MQFAQDGTVVCLNDVGMMDTQMNTSCTNLNTEDMLNWYDPLCTETDKSYITFSRSRPAWMASFTSWAKLSPRLLEILEMYSTRQVVYQRIYSNRNFHCTLKYLPNSSCQMHPNHRFQVTSFSCCNEGSKWFSIWSLDGCSQSQTQCLQPLGVSPKVGIWMIMMIILWQFPLNPAGHQISFPKSIIGVSWRCKGVNIL